MDMRRTRQEFSKPETSRNVKVSGASQLLLYEHAKILTPNQLLNLFPLDTLALLDETFSRLYTSHPYYLELFPIESSKEQTRKFPILSKVVKDQVEKLHKVMEDQAIQYEYYKKLEDVDQQIKYGGLIFFRDELSKALDALHFLFGMPQNFFKALRTLKYVPMETYDQLVKPEYGKREPYPNWFEREREQTLKKKVGKLENLFKQWLQAQWIPISKDDVPILKKAPEEYFGLLNDVARVILLEYAKKHPWVRVKEFPGEVLALIVSQFQQDVSSLLDGYADRYGEDWKPDLLSSYAQELSKKKRVILFV